MKETLFSLFRWIIYIPLIFTIPAVLQSIAVYVGSLGPWWIWFFVYSMFGWTLTLGIMYGIASICPLPKYPNLLFIGFFLVSEGSYLYFNGPGSTALEIILRLGTDFMITMGVLAGGLSPSPYKKLTTRN